VACVHAQNGLHSLRYFWLPPAQLLRLALVDPTGRYLRAWKPVPPYPQFDRQRVISRFFFPLPLPTAAFSTIMAKRKTTAEELDVRAESNGYKRGVYREKDSTRDNEKHNKKTKRNQNSVLDCYVLQRDQCLSARTNFDTG
jgi:hypothetical protein